jgi:diadenosine tetraphosphate (Ap4A) HIT family hydrolase
MKTLKSCVFCEPQNLEPRIIRREALFTSFVSVPHFRDGQCLVIPNRHVTTIGELTIEEGGAIMVELGRLSALLDGGTGTGVMQKYQPLQAENGIKVHHLHFHVFPRLEAEEGLFPVPTPNSFDGFTMPDERAVSVLRVRLQ